MILACQNICKAFGSRELLKNASFHIEDREKTAIVGINGVGGCLFYLGQVIFVGANQIQHEYAYLPICLIYQFSQKWQNSKMFNADENRCKNDADNQIIQNDTFLPKDLQAKPAEYWKRECI